MLSTGFYQSQHAQAATHIVFQPGDLNGRPRGLSKPTRDELQILQAHLSAVSDHDLRRIVEAACSESNEVARTLMKAMSDANPTPVSEQPQDLNTQISAFRYTNHMATGLSTPPETSDDSDMSGTDTNTRSTFTFTQPQSQQIPSMNLTPSLFVPVHQFSLKRKVLPDSCNTTAATQLITSRPEHPSPPSYPQKRRANDSNFAASFPSWTRPDHAIAAGSHSSERNAHTNIFWQPQMRAWTNV